MLFSKIDLSGAQEWDPKLLEEAKQLFHEYAHIFALESLEMGHTSMAKHKIRLNNYTPFKERYHRIPPNLFDEVRNHLKEMIEVGAIQKSSSPWASAVVLVTKKMVPYDSALIYANLTLVPSKKHIVYHA